MQSTVQVSRLCIDVAASDPQRWSIADGIFGACARDDRPLGERHAAFAVRFQQEAPALPAEPPDLSFEEIDVWLRPGACVASHAGGVVAHRDAAGGVAVGGPLRGPDPDRAYRRAVQYPLCDALADAGHHALHAAVLARDGRALLAFGATGSGKSTLALAGARHGWDVLSDDIALVAPPPTGGIGAWATGLPKPITVDLVDLTEDTSEAQAVPADPRGRWRLGGVAMVSSGPLPVAGVVVVLHSSDDGALAPIAPGPVLLEVVAGYLFLGRSPARMRAFFPHAAALSRLPAAFLTHDADPARRVGVAGRLLDTAWQRFTRGHR